MIWSDHKHHEEKMMVASVQYGMITAPQNFQANPMSFCPLSWLIQIFARPIVGWLDEYTVSMTGVPVKGMNFTAAWRSGSARGS